MITCITDLRFMSDLTCNICGSCEFQPFGCVPRLNAQCCKCGSLERHRAVHLVLDELGLLQPELRGNKRSLQLAPERVTYDYMHQVYGSGYYSSDLVPSKYKHAKCLRLALPEDFARIPDEYFFLILHNHVMEHIPGSYISHVDEFHRILEKDGYMVFTCPDHYIIQGRMSVEGGENLETDAERLKLFGQEDHYKLLGVDLVDYLRSKFSSVDLLADPRSIEAAAMLAKHNATGIVFACKK
jgi:hypothetical protein